MSSVKVSYSLTTHLQPLSFVRTYSSISRSAVFRLLLTSATEYYFIAYFLPVLYSSTRMMLEKLPTPIGVICVISSDLGLVGPINDFLLSGSLIELISALVSF